MIRVPLIFAAGFRRWVTFTPTEAELRLVNAFEAQRQRRDSVQCPILPLRLADNPRGTPLVA